MRLLLAAPRVIDGWMDMTLALLLRSAVSPPLICSFAFSSSQYNPAHCYITRCPCPLSFPRCLLLLPPYCSGQIVSSVNLIVLNNLKGILHPCTLHPEKEKIGHIMAALVNYNKISVLTNEASLRICKNLPLIPSIYLRASLHPITLTGPFGPVAVFGPPATIALLPVNDDEEEAVAEAAAALASSELAAAGLMVNVAVTAPDTEDVLTLPVVSDPPLPALLEGVEFPGPLELDEGELVPRMTAEIASGDVSMNAPVGPATMLP